MSEMTDKEKTILTVDLAKKFLNNLASTLDSVEFSWMFDPKKYSLKNGKLTLTFALKEGVLPKEKIRQDKSQTTLTKHMNDEELEEIPT